MQKTKNRTYKEENIRAGDFRTFKSSFALIAIVLSIAYIIQTLSPNFKTFFSGKTLGSSLLILSFLIFLCIFRTKFYDLITSYKFTISLITTVILFTILGTLILQNAREEDYIKFYGKTVSYLLNTYFLTDIFHSVWFNSLLFLMTICLLLVIIKRNPFKFSQLGFLFTHCGILILLIGCLIATLFGEKGFIHSYVGHPINSMLIMEKGNLTKKTKNLDFSFRLDDFKVEYYEADFKIYVYKKEKENYPLVVSYKLQDLKDLKKIPGTEIFFRILKENIKDIKTTNVEHTRKQIHKIKTAEGKEFVVKVGDIIEIEENWKVEIIDFYPDFTYDTENKKAVNKSNKAGNPALQVKFINDDFKRVDWLFAYFPDFSILHKKNEIMIPKLRYIFEDCCQTQIPSIELEISFAGNIVNETLRDKNNQKYLVINEYVIALEKKEEVKHYKSFVSILEEGRVEKNGVVEVNSPLEYNGYMFYQSNYDPNDSFYSGIQVVKDPGLIFVYIGFVMLCVGVVLIFYVRPRLLKI